MVDMPPLRPPGLPPEASDPGCWPDDPDYISGRVSVNYVRDLKPGCFFQAQLLGPAGQPLSGEIDVSEAFQVRFRAEPQPREQWADAHGVWIFDLLFTPVSSSSAVSTPPSTASELRLSALLPQGGMLSAPFEGGKTPCVDVSVTVPPHVLPGLGGLHEATATVAFQPTSGPIAPLAAPVQLGSYLLRGVPSPAPGQVKTGGTTPAPALSETMRSIATELPSGEVTAFDIARAIAGHHPEYAGGRLGGATLSAPPDVATYGWEMWRDSVAQLYDPTAVASSKHEVIDGRLFLVGLGLVDGPLREALERPGCWAPLLLEVDEAVAPAGSVLWPALQAVQFAYGYQSDGATGKDQLGVQGEVNAVCEVITDPEVKPPLAVGLFGEWGAGKSFFMEKMRERVAELTTGPTRRRNLDVVQIRFNAWHYADTSLWASLAIEIFERLADPEPIDVTAREQWLRDHGDSRRAEREQLIAQLETHRTAKAALDSELIRLEDERDAVKAQREEASQQRREAVASFPLTDVLGELANDQDVQAAIRKVATALGLTPAVEELTALGAELRTTAGYLTAVWRLVKHKTWAVVLMAAFVVLTVATAVLVARGGWAWLASAATAASAVGSVVVTTTRLVRPAARGVNTALAGVESAITVASRAEARLRAQRDREERQLELRLTELDGEIAEATRAAAALDEKIATTRAAADALTVGRGLYEFLADRAAGYQKHQGIVGMLHRDFRFLDAQLRAYLASPDRVPGLPAIDRVILYIDDLDRCPPAKVLEVLEAVHLLLALELFTVVVGVDSRWLQRSLRHQYRDLAMSGDPTADPYLWAMPIEYLEKIFQIPLTLPAMQPVGYASLIASLAPSVHTPASSGTVPETPTPRASADESPGGDRVPARALLEVQPGSSAAGPGGQSIDLTPAEVQFAQQLGPLVDSPRAAKRLMNTYRLIRATQHVGSRSRFLGSHGPAGEYQAVLTLLAVAAGYPRIVDRLLVALQHDVASQAITRWPDFVAALGPGGANGSPGALVPRDLTGASLGAIAKADAASWANLHQALQACAAQNGLADLEPYQRWGSVVARFSFTL
jgi:hypothetical protein